MTFCMVSGLLPVFSLLQCTQYYIREAVKPEHNETINLGVQQLKIYKIVYKILIH